MFNLKVIIGAVVFVALIVGGVIDIKVYPAELPKVPGRLLALVEGEEYLEQGQDYVKNLFASMKSEDKSEGEESTEEEGSGEVAGAKDQEAEKKEVKTEESPKATEKPKIQFEGVTVPLRF